MGQQKSLEAIRCKAFRIILDVFESVSGGDKRDRTADLYNAIVALYQLSYIPVGADIKQL